MDKCIAKLKWQQGFDSVNVIGSLSSRDVSAVLFACYKNKPP